jgi:predicted permease
MKPKEISGIAAIAIALSSLLLLGPGLLIPVSGSAIIAPAAPQGMPVYAQAQQIGLDKNLVWLYLWYREVLSPSTSRPTSAVGSLP